MEAVRGREEVMDGEGGRDGRKEGRASKEEWREGEGGRKREGKME